MPTNVQLENRIKELEKTISSMEQSMQKMRGMLSGNGQIINSGKRLEIDRSVNISQLMNRISTIEEIGVVKNQSYTDLKDAPWIEQNADNALFPSTISRKVGIKTKKPEADLSVNGGAHIGGVTDPGDNNLSVDGLIGIGVLSPASLLELWDDDANPILTVTAKHDTDYDPQVHLRVGVTPAVVAQMGYDVNASILSLYVGAGTIRGNSHVAIDSSGNVGIGEPAPQDKIEVNGTALFKDKVKFTQDDGNEYIDSEADGDLDIVATTNIDIRGNPTRVGDGGTTDYVEIDNTGDILFNGGAGLAFGEISASDADTAITISGTGQGNKVQVTIFDTNGASNNTTPDHTNDHITITEAGIYRAIVSIVCESGTGSGFLAGFSLYKNNGATEFPNVHVHRNLSGGGGDVGSLNIHGLVDLAVDDTIEVWVWNETNTTNIIVDDITLSLIQVGGT